MSRSGSMSTPIGEGAIATAQKFSRPETEISSGLLGASSSGAPEAAWPMSTRCGETPSRAATARRVAARRRRKPARMGSRGGASARSRGVGGKSSSPKASVTTATPAPGSRKSSRQANHRPAPRPTYAFDALRQTLAHVAIGVEHRLARPFDGGGVGRRPIDHLDRHASG